MVLTPQRPAGLGARAVAGLLRFASGLGLVHWLQRMPFIYQPLRSLLVSSAGGPDRPREILNGPLAGFRMVLGPHDRNAYLLNTHEPAIVELAAGLCRPGMHVLDVGAHVGYFSLLFAVRTGSAGRVTTLEPNPANVAKIRAMIAANALENIELLPLAASDADGTVEFATEETGQMGHITPAQSAARPGVVTVQATRIDTLSARPGFRPVDLLKLDVEGAEVAALHGMAALLVRDRPIIICEWHPAAAGSDFSTTFQSLGYECELLEPASNTTPFHLLARPARATRPHA